MEKKNFLSLSYLFFFLFVLFLPSQLGYHVWPEWALVLGRRVDYLSPTLYFTDILMGLFLLFYWIPKGTGPRIKSAMTNRLFSLLLLILLISLNITFAKTPIVAAISWIRLLLLVVTGITAIRLRPPVQFFLTPLLIGGVFSSLLGIAQMLHGGSLGGLFWFLGERTFTLDTPGITKTSLCLPSQLYLAGRQVSTLTSHFSLSCPTFLRAYATFPHPNVLGGYLAIILLFVLLEIRHPHSKSKLPIIYIALLVCLIGLVFTASRTAIAAFLLGGSWIVGSLKIKQIVLIGTVLLTILSFIPLPYSSFISFFESFNERQILLESAYTVFFHSSLLGVGLNNFLIALPFSLPIRTIYFLQPVHNVFLLIFSELGIVGSIFFGLILYRITKKINFNKSYKFFTPLLALYVISLFDHYLLTLHQGHLLILITIVGISLYTRFPSRSSLQ